MCGIVGYIGNRNSIPILIEGLKRLEYRGYDSAGIGIIHDERCKVIKQKGKVSQLESEVEKHKVFSKFGIAHTRWATHGVPNQTNAHPHVNSDENLFLVHNGIIENYNVLKKSLESNGYKFYSDTDSEVLVKLIDSFLKTEADFAKPVRYALNKVEEHTELLLDLQMSRIK